MNVVKKLGNQTFDYDLNEERGLMRIIQYTIKGKTYYMGTNLYTANIEYIKKIYHDRWFTEEYFKTIKVNMISNNLNYKSSNKINIFSYAQNILTNIARYLEFLFTKYCDPTNKLKNKYNINHRNSLFVVSNSLLFLFLYKFSVKKIITYLNIIGTTIVIIKCGRHFPRIRIIPPSKWYRFRGNRT